MTNNNSQYWQREVFTQTIELESLRKKIIIIGEHGGEVHLSRSESKLLASLLRDWRHPDNILES